MDKTKVCILAFLLAMATGPAVFGEVLPPHFNPSSLRSDLWSEGCGILPSRTMNATILNGVFQNCGRKKP